MKIKLAIASAALFATSAAFAQMAQPGGAAASPATPPMTTGATTDPTGGTSTDTMGTTGTTTTTETMSSGTTGSGTSSAMSSGMTQGADGKWMNGDRAATKAEISAHKKAMKASQPR